MEHENITKKSAKKQMNAQDRRFEPTKTGLVGLKRDTMLQNELQFLVNYF
jgi:hypothetical protein